MLNLPDAVLDDNEDYDEGFEDEDYGWLLCLINWHLSDPALIGYQVYKITPFNSKITVDRAVFYILDT